MAFTITFDPEKCQGYANCIIEAPAIWDFDEDANIAVVKQAHPDDSLREQANASARGCPAHAITIEDA